MSKSKIEWTEHTWNPVRGCSMAAGSNSPVDGGCYHCYAARMAERSLPGMLVPSTGQPFAIMSANGPRWTGRVELIPSMLDKPLKRLKPTTWFVNSMSDLFHESLPDEDIERVFAVASLCQQHTLQMLTKRADRMVRWFNDEIPLSTREEFVMSQAAHTGKVVWDSRGSDRNNYWGCARIGDISNRRVWPGWPLPNVWLGVSCETQPTADLRAPRLLRTPAAVRFLSLEPLLGPIDIEDFLPSPSYSTGKATARRGDGIDWVIVGGESGPGARPMHPDWVRSIRDQCQAAGVPFFFKQWGEWAPKANFSGIAKWDEAPAYTLVMPDGQWDGTVVTGSDDPDPEFGLRTCDLDGNDGAAAMARIGKKAAGALLDGREWREMPKAKETV